MSGTQDTPAVWERAQAIIDGLTTKRARRAHLKMLEARESQSQSGYTDMVTALVYDVLTVELKHYQKITAKQASDSLYGAVASGRVRTSVVIDGERHIIPASVYPQRH
jgi:hypothetical protein